VSTITEVQGKLEDRRAKLAAVFDEAGSDLDMSKVKSLEGDTTAKVEQIRAMNAEIDDFAKELEEFRGLEAISEKNAKRGEVDRTGRALAAAAGRGAGEEQQYEPKTLGELFVQTDAFKRKTGPIGPVADLGLGGRVSDMRATLFTETAGYAPQNIRTGKVVPFATRPIQVIDLIPGGTTIGNAVVYMEETTFTNSAAETAEGGTYPESALALTERSSPVRKIATFLPVTDEQLEDVDGIQNYIDNRLTFMLRQRLDSQILVGNGTPPNLTGILNVGGSLQTQARGADPAPDAVYKAMTLVRVTGRANPNGVVIHPLDWQGVKLLRTADGIYIWGNPADNAPDRVWGLTVALSDAITLHTALVGDFTFSELAMRRDIQVQISNSHSTFFIEGKQAIRADVRAALIIYRAAAFCTVTGLV
jgi:HK97 family phage major capsid protein